jgi:glycosyltransferase involved in cell wall biosynthesis
MSKLSVIIPSYQHADSLRICLCSVLAQTRKADEIIVVNDGSTDHTDEVAHQYKDSIFYIKQENQGEQAARMRGFNESTGDLVLFLDSDVVMIPEMLEKMEGALQSNPDAGYAYSSFIFGPKKFKSFLFDSERLKKINYIHTSALIRRECFPGFDPEIKKFQDWDIWLTLLERGKRGVFIDEFLFNAKTDSKRGGISQWMPSFMYKLPWGLIGWKPKAIQKYEKGLVAIKAKHNL